MKMLMFLILFFIGTHANYNWSHAYDQNQPKTPPTVLSTAFPTPVAPADCSTANVEPATALPMPECTRAAVDPAIIPLVPNPNAESTDAPPSAPNKGTKKNMSKRIEI